MSIGWSFLSSQDCANSILARGIIAIDEVYQAEGADLNRNRFCLLRFIKEMRSGDVVIIPYGAYFGVYKISDNNIITNVLNTEKYDSIYQNKIKHQFELLTNNPGS